MNLLLYCLSFGIILYFFSKFHKTSLIKEKLKYGFFSALYILFVISYNPYFEWKAWVLIALLLYCVLDDILHKEFNILLPLFASIGFLVMKPDVIVISAILFVFVSFYLFALFIHLIRNRRDNDSEEIKDTSQEEKKKTKFKSPLVFLSNIFSRNSGMGEGDPWIICGFLLLIPLVDWITYLLVNWILILLFFVINRFIKKPRKSIPLAPILLLSLIIYLFVI